MKEICNNQYSGKLILFLFIYFLTASQLFSQTYLGVSYNNGDPANSTNLSLMQKITFSGTNITFLLTDNSSVTKAFSTISKFSFSGIDGGNPLPVELTSFSAVINGNKVTLKWSTATEVNNYGFDVERSAVEVHSSEWDKIGFVTGHGNSNSPKKYTFTDIPQGGTKFQYRLKQIDTDGKYEYSNVVSVDLEAPSQYSLNQNYPNPFNPSTKITFSIPNDGLVTMKVFDVLGREVASLVNENKIAGNYEVVFNGTGIASGIFICKMSSANFSSSIKMLMLK